MAEDRTTEFLSLARSLPSDGTFLTTNHITALPPSSSASGSGSSGNNRKQNDSSYAQLRDFHTKAGGISRDIATTSSLLQELTQLVRQKSLFQDDTAQVNDLVMRIKAAIENLNSRLDDAGRSLAQQKRALGKNSQAGQQASNLVDGLKAEFGQAANGFKTILQQRTDVLKETTDRKRDIYGGNDTSDGYEDVPILNLENRPPVYYDSATSGGIGGSMGMGVAGFPTLDLTSGMTTGEPTGPQLPRPHGAMGGYDGIRHRKAGTDQMPTYSGSAPTYYGRQESNPLTPWDIQRMEQESGQDQLMQLIPDQDYLRERADAMEQVESNIIELGTIFNRLAVMVNEHKDMVQRVEDNVDEADSMINLSLNTLMDTLTNLQTNRALFLKVFAVLVVFIIAFILLIA